MRWVHCTTALIASYALGMQNSNEVVTCPFSLCLGMMTAPTIFCVGDADEVVRRVHGLFAKQGHSEADASRLAAECVSFLSYPITLAPTKSALRSSPYQPAHLNTHLPIHLPMHLPTTPRDAQSIHLAAHANLSLQIHTNTVSLSPVKIHRPIFELKELRCSVMVYKQE